MFINDTLKTKFVFRRKSGASASIRSPMDINPVIESNSLIVDDTTSPPSPSKARKLRILSNLSLFKKTSLSKVFKKVPAIQTLPIVLHRTTTAALDPLRHIPAVSEDGFLHFATPSPTEHQERGTDFGLISSTVDEPSNQEDINPDPPGSRIADRVTSLRMRTAAVWASIPATMEGLSASCVSSEASTPVKSQINFLEQDETTSVETATVDSPLFSSPATSATAVSDWGPRDSLVNLSMIGHKQERIRIMPKVSPALDVISLAQPPEFLGLTRVKPPSECQNIEEKFNYTPNSPASGSESSPGIPSSSSEERANLRAARLLDSPSPSPRTVHIAPSTAVCPIVAERSFPWLPVVQLFTNLEEDPTTSNIRGSLTVFQKPLATEMPLRPWSCAKITRAETKQASRKEQLNKEGLFTRISRFLEAGPQNHLPVSSKR